MCKPQTQQQFIVSFTPMNKNAAEVNPDRLDSVDSADELMQNRLKECSIPKAQNECSALNHTNE
jgi:hypothetical protein